MRLWVMGALFTVACGDNVAPVQVVALVSTAGPPAPADLMTWSNDDTTVIASEVVAWSWSPDRRWITTTPIEGDVSLWSLDGEGSASLPHVYDYSITWAPDSSRFVAHQSDGGVVLVTLENEPRVSPLAMEDPKWTPAGNLISSTMRRWCNRDGEQCRDLEQACSMSRDDQVIACLVGFRAVELERRDGTAIGTWDLPGQLTFIGLSGTDAWSPDSSRLALMRRTPFNDELWIGEPTAAPALVASFPVGVQTVAWSSDNRHIAAQAEDGCWLVDADTGVNVPYPSSVYPPVFSPDGAHLAVVDHSVTLLVDVAQHTTRTLPGGWGVSFSSRGQYMQIDPDHLCSVRTGACTESPNQSAAWFEDDDHVFIWQQSGDHQGLLEVGRADGSGMRTPMFDAAYVQNFQVR